MKKTKSTDSQDKPVQYYHAMGRGYYYRNAAGDAVFPKPGETHHPRPMTRKEYNLSMKNTSSSKPAAKAMKKRIVGETMD